MLLLLSKFSLEQVGVGRAELVVQGAVQIVGAVGGNVQIVCTGRQRAAISTVKRQLTARRNVHRVAYQFAGRRTLMDFYGHHALGVVDDMNLPVAIARIDRPRYDLVGRVGIEFNRGARSYYAAYALRSGNRSGRSSVVLNIYCACAHHQSGRGHAACKRYAHHFLKLVHVNLHIRVLLSAVVVKWF